ncbi:MAG: hypothetical protein GY792_06620 [Gammaproteobacteria bacterium]|nr:hypothetical protein [Gammaproteobacteria bacterium]
MSILGRMPTRLPSRMDGFIGIIVAVGIFALAGTAGFLSVVINSGNNRRTMEVLADPEATTAELESISDQDIRNLRNDLADNFGLASGFAGGLGTPTLPGGGSTAELAGNALEEQIRNIVNPAVVDYLSNPESSWNRDGGANRPGEGTVPSGGVLPEDIAGGSGDVRFTLVWNANVDLDLHALDPCGVEISFRNSSNVCNGDTGQLDVDDIPGGPGSTENIFWGEGAAPVGAYQYWVECFGGCDSEAASFTLSRTVDGVRTSTAGTLIADKALSQVITFTR